MRSLNITISQPKTKKYMQNEIYNLIINRDETHFYWNGLNNCTDYELKLLLKASKELTKEIKEILSR